jgi:hypothetical protein
VVAGITNQAEGLRRSIVGYSTKLHVITDSLVNPIDFVLTKGQNSDIGQDQRLAELTPTGPETFMTNKYYDCDTLIAAIDKKYDRCYSFNI